ncbi:hypothetical protein JCM19239_2026 [Vibrio variabilis]|uniref:Uncharacterized protein n=1 Tax=Vibrio variabilis TaxID=990271 RepID=A0ABQ0J731_9VIBR|nr:hypothetical protein JCM19239_2026 [Vibrio variabilis]
MVVDSEALAADAREATLNARAVLTSFIAKLQFTLNVYN